MTPSRTPKTASNARRTRSRTHALLRGAALAAALGLVTACTPSAAGRNAIDETLGVRGAPVALPARAEFAEIASLEEARRSGNGRLQELLVQGDAAVRARAAQALGRLPIDRYASDVTEPLCLAVGDTDAGVRATAARALGWRGDQAAAGVIARAFEDPDPAVRAALVDAASRLGGVELARLVIKRLYDPVLSVRLEAISACAALPTDGAVAAEIDRELLGVLNPLRRRGAVGEPNEHEIWMTLHTLGRRKSELGRGAFLEHDRDSADEARIFAMIGLARIRSSPEGLHALERGVSDADWRVSVEALRGLAVHADENSLPAVLGAVEARNAHVRRTAAEALASFADQADKLRPALLKGLRDKSSSVRAAALVSFAGVFGAQPAQLDQVVQQVEAFASESDVVARRGAAQACRHLGAERGTALAVRLLADGEAFVSTIAIESLGEIASPAALAKLREIVATDTDNGRRLSAVLALRPHASASDVAALAAAATSAVGDVGPELTWNALQNFATLDAAALGDQGRDVLSSSLRSQNPQVRAVAIDVWTKVLGADSLPLVPPPTATPRVLPLPGRDYPRWERNPVVEVVTSRGSLVFELLPGDAPLHVYSFVQLCEQQHYDETRFHRVVPDFVVQGGDYRGDGNGGLDWRGESLRHELNTRHFLRGSLGMPRNEWLDSGGSQIFVTHRPTPHLDGNYTLFGRLVLGFDVLDAIEEGDRIVGTRIVDDGLGL